MKANPDHFKKHSVSKLLHYGLGAFSFLVAAVSAPAAELFDFGRSFDPAQLTARGVTIAVTDGALNIKGTVPANAWFRIATGQLEAKEGGFILKGQTPARITAAGAQLAGKNLVLPAKPGVITVTYQWAQ
jgi:hypothetical protein